jgi:hypothetical protein
MEKQICKKCFAVSDEEGNIKHAEWCEDNKPDFMDIFNDILKTNDKSE